MFLRLHKLLLATAIVPLSLTPALAGPNGASVVAGSATVQGQGTASVVVNQSSQKAIINWNTFNISTGERTAINMPGASSVELDRVTGGLGPSQIYGSLSSNGQVFLVNPDGVLVGPTGKINTASFLATTHDIANSDFMAGRYSFSIPGMPNASVVNQGSITAQTGGFAALVAPGVRNTGIISAKLGTVALASGNAFTLDFYGDNLITLGLNDSIAASVTDVSTGQPLSSLVSNTGTLKANGGRVELTAVAARAVVDSVINNTGVVEANTIGTHNGMIELGAATAANTPAGAPPQTVKVSGKLSAAGRRKGTGGTVLITGENVQLSGANINASGKAGGGTVLIGGDTGGGNPSALAASIAGAALESFAVPNATTVNVDANSVINASATDTGNGGKVIVWSNEATTFYGTILAKGGPRSGDGGFVETSGHELTFNGTVSTSALNGANGTLLLDPLNAIIAATAGSEVITVSSIESALATGDVVVTTVGTTGSQAGDITVASSLSWANASTLTLNSYRDITVNDGVTIANTGAGNLVLRADATGTGVGTINFLGNGQADFSQSTGAVSIYYNPADNPAGSIVNATSYVTPSDYSPFVLVNSALPSQLTAYMLVNSVYDLQNIQNNLSGNYAIGTNIDASGTASWNMGAGFVPIGIDGSAFTGTLDGQYHLIDDLYINNSTAANVGLFESNGGFIRNLALANVDISAANAVADTGALAGNNTGTITNVSASGSVDYSSNFSVTNNVGGLVGENSGSIINSSTAETVSIANTVFGTLGGLVGLNSGTISQSYANGTITNNGLAWYSFGTSSAAVGGLVGANSGIIDQSYFEGTVEGGMTEFGAGGLVGANGNTITDSYAVANVSGNSFGGIGVLTGFNSGMISQSYAGGSVGGGGLNYLSFGGFWYGNFPVELFLVGPPLGNGVGGLVGTNFGSIANSFATTTVDAGATYGNGGLVGFNVGGSISDSYATGSVTGAGGWTGGLVGSLNGGAIGTSFASGDVTGTQNVGGLAGANNGGTISQSFATGSVTISGQSGEAGGLVGSSDGVITDSYSTSAVSAVPGTDVGGLVGFLNGGNIDDSYFAGSVTVPGGSTEQIGALVGFNLSAVVQNSYWNSSIVPQWSGVGTNNGSVSAIFGLSTTQAKAQASYTTDRITGTNWDFTTIWSIVEDQTYPLLIGSPTMPTSGALPGGFDPTVWGISASINNGYPYLLWQVAGAAPTSPTTLPVGAPPQSSMSANTPSLPPGWAQIVDPKQPDNFTQYMNWQIAPAGALAGSGPLPDLPTFSPVQQAGVVAVGYFLAGPPGAYAVEDIMTVYGDVADSYDTLNDIAQGKNMTVVGQDIGKLSLDILNTPVHLLPGASEGVNELEQLSLQQLDAAGTYYLYQFYFAPQ